MKSKFNIERMKNQKAIRTFKKQTVNYEICSQSASTLFCHYIPSSCSNCCGSDRSYKSEHLWQRSARPGCWPGAARQAGWPSSIDRLTMPARSMLPRQLYCSTCNIWSLPLTRGVQCTCLVLHCLAVSRPRLEACSH